MHIKKWLRQALVVCCASVLTGCDVLLDTAFDCIDSDGPEFNKSVLVQPVLNQVYTESIVVSINNEPRDDRFGYRFAVTGNLPAGLSTDAAGRNFFINGTATELGTFSFTLFVEVEDTVSPENSGLCFTVEERQFQLTVQPL